MALDLRFPMALVAWVLAWTLLAAAEQSFAWLPTTASGAIQEPLEASQ